MTTSLVKQIAKAVRQGLSQAKAVEAATLIKITPGTRTAGNLAAGTNPTPTSYACQGFVSDDKHEKIGATLVEQDDRVVCLVGDTLSGQTPTSKDKITIDGKTQRIVDLEGNPALWTCLCRS